MASSVAGPSTYYFASRHQQKQGADDANFDDDGFASPPSSILQRLRRIEARAAALSPKETHTGRHVSGNTELVWEDKTLVWSRGGQLVRTFTFQHDIVQACWASMGQRSTRSRRQQRDGKGSNDDGMESSFSTAQRQMRASWAGGDESAPSSSSHLGPRQLVVILSDAFWVYSPSSGHEYTTAKNFKLAKAWPATTGVFLQRSLEAEDHLDATPQLPTLFYLGHHLDEVTPVAVSSSSGSTLAFTEDVKESIVFVCDQGHSRILVTIRPGAGEIRLYAYAIARHGAHTPQPQPQPHPQRPPFQRQQSTSAANMSRSESAPNNPTSQIGKGRPSMPRRSSRLSSHNTSTVGAPSLKSAPPMTRRRSSRYPSSGGDLGNMSRIDETFNHSAAAGGHAGPSSASMAAAAAVNASSAAAITNFEQQEDAVEAEEMGQMVEGLARKKTLPDRGADESLARRPSMGSTRHRRTSNLGRSVPYTPRNLNPRLSTGRGCLSRDGIELDFDPMSMSAAAGGTLGGATLAEEDFSQHLAEEKDGAAKRDLGAMEHAATAVLQLVDVVRVELWSDGVGDAVKVFAHEDGNLLQVYLHAQGPLFHRTLRRLDDGRLEVVGQGCVDARGAAAVEVEGGKRHVVLLSGRGTLHLCLEASPSGLILDLTLQRNRDAWLLTPAGGEHGPTAASLSSEDGASLNLKLESGEDVAPTLDFAYSPRNATIRRLLTALKTCTTVGAHLRRAWILANASGAASEWEPLRQALCGASADRSGLDDDLLAEVDTLGLFATSQPPKMAHTTGLDPTFRPEAARILSVLNAVAQDCRLDATSPDLEHLARIITQVGAACGARRLVTYWSMLAPTASVDSMSPDASLDAQPTDVFQLLAQSCQQPNAHLARLGMDERQVSASMPTFARLLRVFQAYHSITREEERFLPVATAIVREGIALDRLPWSLWLPLRLVLTRCAQQPLARVPPQVCRLIERYDLARPRRETQMRYHSDALRVLPSGPRQLHPLSAMLFSKDYRLHDVVEMLETHRIIYVQAPASTTKTDEELREIGISLLHNVGERIKASPIGRGMLFFLTRAFRPTLRWDTPPLNRRVLLRPPQPYHHPEPRLDSPEFEWPEFHNGAASALEMVVTGKAKVDSIWYFSQGAGERNARHAGLLLGLGLAGHFATIGQVHTYRYLGDRHGLTSIGLLLGLSATFAGRGDPDVRSLLACHVKAFLPEHSANLAHSTLVQAAALLGTGLLFLGADVSHIAEALCDQIGAQEIETTDPTMLSRAAYSLSAAFGAGLVMLGRGRRCAMTMRDKKLCRKLERYMVGASRDSFAEETASDLVWRVDERITSSTAAVAYALFFLKSNQQDAARSIPMPKDFVELDAMRPDILLIHSVARNLIMWDPMAPTTQWLESTLPAFLRTRTASPIAMQVKTNIIAGACLALSFKYAGSADAQAKQLLLSVYRDFEEQASRTSKQTYDGRVLYSTLRSSSDIIALALAVVLAGTGDLDLLKILRPAHARVPCSEPYGSHMAIHMAMGLLFLGGGRLTLGTSDASVAAMLIAFYPRFPTRATDNRSHLQAYRHLWVLAVEPRLVVTQDVASGEMACVPIEVRARNGAEMAATTPFQLPHLDHIASISLESNRYEQTTLDSAHRRFQLKRKEGHLDYSRDPQGHRTAMAREMAKEREAVGPRSSAMLAPPSRGEQGMLSPNLRLLLAHARGDERLVSSLRQCVDRNAPSLLALGVTLEQLPRARCAQTIRDWMWAPRFLALLGLEAEPQLDTALGSLREAARKELGVAEVREALLSPAAGNGRLAFVLAALAPAHAVEDLARLRGMMSEAAEALKREGIADQESVVEALVDVGRAATRGEVDRELIKSIAALAA